MTLLLPTLTALTALPAQAPSTADLLDACGTDPGWVCRKVLDATGQVWIAELSDWLVTRPARVFLILLAAWIANRLVGRSIRKIGARIAANPRTRGDRLLNLERARQRADTLSSALRGIASVVIYTIALFAILDVLAIDVTGLVASAGFIGAGLAFGAQSVVRDFLAGLYIISEDQFGVGDQIDAGEAKGVVESVTLRATHIRDINGTLWHVSNGELRVVGNLSQQWARTILDLEVPYDADLDAAARVLKEVAEAVRAEELEHATILDPPQVWGVQEFRREGVVIRLGVKVRPGQQFATAREIRGRLKPALEEAGVHLGTHEEPPPPVNGSPEPEPRIESPVRSDGAPEEPESP